MAVNLTMTSWQDKLWNDWSHEAVVIPTYPQTPVLSPEEVEALEKVKKRIAQPVTPQPGDMDRVENLATIMRTSTAFRAWLMTKQPVETVGVRASADDCPIARFLRETFNCRIGVMAGGVSYAFGTRSGTIPAARWQNCFVGTLDRRSGYYVTRDTALAVLVRADKGLL